MDECEVTKEWIKAFASLSEAQKRWFAAAKSIEIGYSGISKVSRATGLSRTTIAIGVKELRQKDPLSQPDDRQRKAGGGRKSVSNIDQNLVSAIEKLVEETSAGDPISTLRWTCKSTRIIADELRKNGFKVSYVTVMRILKSQGYSLRSNKKMLSGKSHPDRDKQFKHISRLVSSFSKQNNPVISVDTKKKELVGNFANKGRNWTKSEVKVLDHDFKSYGEGTAIPYGAYDVNRNEGFVNVGTTSDTSEFAVNSIWQ